MSRIFIKSIPAGLLVLLILANPIFIESVYAFTPPEKLGSGLIDALIKDLPDEIDRSIISGDSKHAAELFKYLEELSKYRQVLCPAPSAELPSVLQQAIKIIKSAFESGNPELIGDSNTRTAIQLVKLYAEDAPKSLGLLGDQELTGELLKYSEIVREQALADEVLGQVVGAVNNFSGEAKKAALVALGETEEGAAAIAAKGAAPTFFEEINIGGGRVASSVEALGQLGNEATGVAVGVKAAVAEESAMKIAPLSEEGAGILARLGAKYPGFAKVLGVGGKFFGPVTSAYAVGTELAGDVKKIGELVARYKDEVGNALLDVKRANDDVNADIKSKTDALAPNSYFSNELKHIQEQVKSERNLEAKYKKYLDDVSDPNKSDSDFPAGAAGRALKKAEAERQLENIGNSLDKLAKEDADWHIKAAGYQKDLTNDEAKLAVLQEAFDKINKLLGSRTFELNSKKNKKVVVPGGGLLNYFSGSRAKICPPSSRPLVSALVSGNIKIYNVTMRTTQPVSSIKSPDAVFMSANLADDVRAFKPNGRTTFKILAPANTKNISFIVTQIGVKDSKILNITPKVSLAAMRITISGRTTGTLRVVQPTPPTPSFGALPSLSNIQTTQNTTAGTVPTHGVIQSIFQSNTSINTGAAPSANYTVPPTFFTAPSGGGTVNTQ